MVVFFQTSILKEAVIYAIGDSVLLNTKFQETLSYTMLIHSWKAFVADIFMITFLHSLLF